MSGFIGSGALPNSVATVQRDGVRNWIGDPMRNGTYTLGPCRYSGAAAGNGLLRSSHSPLFFFEDVVGYVAISLRISKAMLFVRWVSFDLALLLLGYRKWIGEGI